MTEEILNNSFQNKISNFIKKKLKYLITIAFFLILILFCYFFYKNVKKKMKFRFQQTTPKLLYSSIKKKLMRQKYY